MKLLKIIGLGSLLHAGYSSYEYTHSQKAHNTSIPFPQDIILEVIISLLILSLDLLFSSNQPKLSLINNDVVKSQFKLKPILMKDAVVEDEKLGAGPFQFVESKVYFTDFAQKRKDYAEWVAKNKKVSDEKEKEENTVELKDEKTDVEESKAVLKEKVEKVAEEIKEQKEEVDDAKAALNESPKSEELESPEPEVKSASKKKNGGKKNGKKSRKA